MQLSLNTMLIIGSCIAIAVVLVIMYINAKRKVTVKFEEKFKNLDEVLEAVKQYMVDLVKEDTNMVVSSEDFERLYKRKARINVALKKCVYGIDSAKLTVIDLIKEFIEQNVPDETVDNILGLNLEEGGEPSDQVMFEIIMYKYQKRYGKDALAEWIKFNNFARERHPQLSDDPYAQSYYITVDDLRRSYAEEKIELTMSEKQDVLAILVYQNYKGFGCIDTIRAMSINGINIGTSGSILETTSANNPNIPRATNSCWIFFQGKYIHMQFVNFGTEDEVKRIIQLVIRWNTPGALTAKRGYLVNTMYDKSRILALRPPACEYWAVFIRKFNLSNLTPEFLLVKDYTKRGDLVINTIKYLVKGEVTCAVTGRQGSGKTTLMSSIIRYIDPRYTIRVLEMAPELYLRELYPDRNILSFQETTTVTAEMLQDAQKKSDGVVSLVGEVATDKVAMNMIQMGMTASKFTIFSHHGNTTKDTVLTLRNSLVNAGGFSNMETAEKQVTDVVRFDIHLERSAEGKPYVQRITEIVQLDSAVPYPEYDPNDPVNSMNRITAEYYRRKTDRISFDTREILSYDLDTDTYFTKHRMTKKTEDFIRSHIPSPNERMRFNYFMAEEWGIDKEFEEDALDETTGEFADSQLPPDIIKEAERLANGQKVTKEIVSQAQENVLNMYKEKVSLIEANMAEQQAAETAAKAAVMKEDTEMADDFFEGIELVKDKTVGIELADEFTIGLFEL